MVTSDGRRPPLDARPLQARSPSPGLALAIGSVVAWVALFLLLALAASAKAAPATVVSLTFDDGSADQMQAVPIMQHYGVKGTFYIVTGVVGTPNYLTRDNLNTLNSDGEEIGGHTVNHPNLTTVTNDEAQSQICDARVTLHNWGFKQTSFAYPYAALNPAVAADVQYCGYNSARSLGGIKSPHSVPSVTALAETIPPSVNASSSNDNGNPAMELAAVSQIDNTWTLEQMENVVTTAQGAAREPGDWVIFTFHHICAGAGCASLSITPMMFKRFVRWLKTQPASTSVKTVDSVIGGQENQNFRLGPPPATSNGLVNGSLETAATPASDFPQCWMPNGWGTNTPTWTRSTDAHTGSFSEGLTITGYVSGDAKIMPTLDLGSCSPTVTPAPPGGTPTTYSIGAWYKSTGTTQFALYYRDSSGEWYYWTSSPWFASASNWTQATWTTPAVPAQATGISFGLALIGNGSLTTDDYTMTCATSCPPATQPTASSPANPGLAASAVTDPSPLAPTAENPRHAGESGPQDLPYLPSGPRVNEGTKVAPPFVSDAHVTTG